MYREATHCARQRSSANLPCKARPSSWTWLCEARSYNYSYVTVSYPTRAHMMHGAQGQYSFPCLHWNPLGLGAFVSMYQSMYTCIYVLSTVYIIYIIQRWWRIYMIFSCIYVITFGWCKQWTGWHVPIRVRHHHCLGCMYCDNSKSQVIKRLM